MGPARLRPPACFLQLGHISAARAHLRYAPAWHKVCPPLQVRSQALLCHGRVPVLRAGPAHHHAQVQGLLGCSQQRLRARVLLQPWLAAARAWPWHMCTGWRGVGRLADAVQSKLTQVHVPASPAPRAAGGGGQLPRWPPPGRRLQRAWAPGAGQAACAAACAGAALSTGCPLRCAGAAGCPAPALQCPAACAGVPPVSRGRGRASTGKLASSYAPGVALVCSVVPARCAGSLLALCPRLTRPGSRALGLLAPGGRLCGRDGVLWLHRLQLDGPDGPALAGLGHACCPGWGSPAGQPEDAATAASGCLLGARARPRRSSERPLRNHRLSP